MTGPIGPDPLSGVDRFHGFSRGPRHGTPVASSFSRSIQLKRLRSAQTLPVLLRHPKQAHRLPSRLPVSRGSVARDVFAMHKRARRLDQPLKSWASSGVMFCRARPAPNIVLFVVSCCSIIEKRRDNRDEGRCRLPPLLARPPHVSTNVKSLAFAHEGLLGSPAMMANDDVIPFAMKVCPTPPPQLPMTPAFNHSLFFIATDRLVGSSRAWKPRGLAQSHQSGRSRKSTLP